MPVPYTRRAFLRRTAAATSATWGVSLWYPGVAQARARTLAVAANAEGTTLTTAFGPAGEGLYVRLTETEGWPTVVREDLGAAKAGREDRRRSIATIVHLTDVHIVDAQSPARVEFLDRDSDPPQQDTPVEGAYRSHETLTTQISDAMNRRIRDVGAGPITGRAYDVCVSTGDNIDNQHANELSWFMTLLDGGSELTPNSGDLTRYEGVQDTDMVSYDTHYWHPDDTSGMPQGSDRYKTVYGFPDMPGLLEAAILPFTTVGIGVRWYSCYGNHDGLLQGNAPSNEALQQIAVGSFKVTGRGATTGDFADSLQNQDPTGAGGLFSGPGRTVTADENRRTVTVADWVQAHLDSPSNPGPTGHGYTAESLDTLVLYYTFEISQGVLGICLDTVNRGGYAEGSIGEAQLAWLEQQLIANSTRYYDEAGNRVDNSAGTDKLMVLFSHHNIPTLNNPFPDPDLPEERVLAGPVESLLHRFDNVVAWVNGHSHVNRVTPFPDPEGLTGGFWEVSTAAHIDFPQMSRIVELVDNEDGTLSIFGTLLDHAGPAQAALSSDVLSLASIARELGYNDPQSPPADGLGAVESRNVELLLAAPFTLDDLGAPVDAGGNTTGPTPPSDGRPDLAATGGGAAVVGAAAIAAAAALRLRNRAEQDDDPRADDLTDPDTTADER